MDLPKVNIAVAASAVVAITSTLGVGSGMPLSKRQSLKDLAPR